MHELDEKNAAKVITFIEKFCCQKNGKPIKLLQWEKELIRMLYGTMRDDGFRQYRHCVLLVARRNGKSVLAACLLIYHLVCDDPASELYLISNTVTQSQDACWDACIAIVEHSPLLKGNVNNRFRDGVLKVEKTKGRIVNRKNRSRLSILTSTTAGNLGKDAQFICYDEFCFFKDRTMITNLKGSQLNREQPIALYISTASDIPEGIGKEIVDYSIRVRDGEIDDPTWLSFLYCADPADDWTSPETWKKANPSCPELIKLEDLQALCNAAMVEPRQKAEFLQFHLNIFQFAAISWLSKESWDACHTNEDIEKLCLGKPLFTGVDTARRWDIAAVVHCCKIGEFYYLLPRFFIPRDLLKIKEHQDKVPYSLWVQQKHVIATDGDVIDHLKIREVIKEDNQKFVIRELAYDPAGSTELLCNQLLRQQDGMRTIVAPQGIQFMSQPSKHFERLVKSKLIRHNNPCLDWMAGNTAIRVDSNDNIAPFKKDSTSRCDGIVAAVMAIGRCLAEEQKGSYVLSW